MAHLTGHAFFPALISSSFAQGLHYAFDFAIICSLIAAAASWMRGGKYIHQEAPVAQEAEYGWIDETDLAIPAFDAGAESVYTLPANAPEDPLLAPPSSQRHRHESP